MKTNTDLKYLEGPKEWTRELFLMFLLGFLLATLLGVAVWFLHSKPAQASALAEQEEALDALVYQQAACEQARETIRREKEETEHALEETARQLREARIGWGRCLRTQESAEQQARR